MSKLSKIRFEIRAPDLTFMKISSIFNNVDIFTKSGTHKFKSGTQSLRGLGDSFNCNSTSLEFSRNLIMPKCMGSIE